MMLGILLVDHRLPHGGEAGDLAAGGVRGPRGGAPAPGPARRWPAPWSPGAERRRRASQGPNLGRFTGSDDRMARADPTPVDLPYTFGRSVTANDHC